MSLRTAKFISIFIIFVSLPTYFVPKEIFDHHFGVEYDTFCRLMDYGYGDQPITYTPSIIPQLIHIIIIRKLVSHISILSQQKNIRDPPFISA